MGGSLALIIEDSRTQALAIARDLERLGWSAIIASNLKEALTVKAPIKLTLLDLNLADACGLEGLEGLRNRFPKTPIAAMTTTGKRLKEAREARCDYLLKKPFEADGFRAVLNDAMAISRGEAKAPYVMVADDSRTQRKAICSMVSTAGCRPAGFEDAETVLQHIAWDRPDAVLIDVFMPGLGGIEGIQRIRSVKPQLPIIAISAGFQETMSSGDALKAASKIGADGVLCKPFGPEALKTTLATHLPVNADQTVIIA